MFNKFELMLGIRYLTFKQKSGFISFISFVSILGISLGVAALITVLSVMNGFQSEIRNKIISISAHMQITGINNVISNWQNIGSMILKTNSEILSYAPYIDGQALISFDSNVNGVLVRGIEPNYETKVEDIEKNMQVGNLKDLIAGKFDVIIGRELANQLGVDIGQKITLITPNGQITPAGTIPRLKQFTVVGIFNLHMSEYDSSLALINLNDAQLLFKFKNNVSGLRLKVSNVMETQKLKSMLSNNIIFKDLIINDWISQHQNYFSAVSLEKKMMLIILSLIIAVASFNLLSTLVMSVREKKSNIAILRTMGASKLSIVKIFVIQGGISGFIGTVIGTIMGLLLAYNIGYIVHIIEQLTGLIIINKDVYMIDYLPSKIIAKDVISIFIISNILSTLATIYPSISASKTNPVEALRYE